MVINKILTESIKDTVGFAVGRTVRIEYSHTPTTVDQCLSYLRIQLPHELIVYHIPSNKTATTAGT